MDFRNFGVLAVFPDEVNSKTTFLVKVALILLSGQLALEFLYNSQVCVYVVIIFHKNKDITEFLLICNMFHITNDQYASKHGRINLK
jgi:hypothetical protein